MRKHLDIKATGGKKFKEIRKKSLYLRFLELSSFNKRASHLQQFSLPHALSHIPGS